MPPECNPLTAAIMYIIGNDGKPAPFKLNEVKIDDGPCRYDEEFAAHICEPGILEFKMRSKFARRLFKKVYADINHAKRQERTRIRQKEKERRARLKHGQNKNASAL